MWRKFMPEMPCYTYTKDYNWNNNQQQGDKQGPSVRPKYQPPSAYEFLQKIMRKVLTTKYNKS